MKRTTRIPRKLRAIVGKEEVPSFPGITTQVLQKLRDPDAAVGDVAECLQWDAVLVLEVLRTVNSAAFGAATQIVDVQHAITFMGRSQLEQLVLAIAIKNCLPGDPAPGFQRGRYWRAAAFRAALGRSLARQLHPARQADAFASGLLQDLAVPILAHSRPAEYGGVLQRWHDGDPARLDELETEAFGWSHGQVGGMLGRVWELPAPLVASIERHHDDRATDEELLPSTRLVSVLRETREHCGVDALVEEARSGYGLAPDWTTEAVATCEEQAEELAQGLFG